MNIYMFKPHEDADDNAKKHGGYYLGYTMLTLAVVAARSEGEARKILVQTCEEDIYQHEDVIECFHVGLALASMNEPKMIEYATGTG